MGVLRKSRLEDILNIADQEKGMTLLPRPRKEEAPNTRMATAPTSLSSDRQTPCDSSRRFSSAQFSLPLQSAWTSGSHPLAQAAHCAATVCAVLYLTWVAAFNPEAWLHSDLVVWPPPPTQEHPKIHNLCICVTLLFLPLSKTHLSSAVTSGQPFSTLCRWTCTYICAWI